ncbi:hypothetical protein [Metamycoplasma hyosynoviae]|uniref:hypothetical protein n=1 Tax=Metamycoplasma hyosynoviae TaxID=29559 RepID=UPI00249CAAD8|nr:hypothetical protein [Metamycoplasma hyosynoviae]MDI3063887.1 hypothetical protein [Metamycoplasma hyosynoviae]
MSASCNAFSSGVEASAFLKPSTFNFRLFDTKPVSLCFNRKYISRILESYLFTDQDFSIISYFVGSSIKPGSVGIVNFNSDSSTSFANLFSLPSTSTVTFFDAFSRFLSCCSSSGVVFLKPVISNSFFTFDIKPLCLCFNLIVTLSLVLSLLSNPRVIKYSNTLLSTGVVSVTLTSLVAIVLTNLFVWFSTETPLIFSISLFKVSFISSVGSALKPLIVKSCVALVPFLMFFNSTSTSNVVGSSELAWWVWVAVNTEGL